MSYHFAYSGESLTLPSGVVAAVARFNPDDLIHAVTFDDQLRPFIKGAADSHGAVFEENNFPKVMNAIGDGKLQAYFLVVAEENCGPRFVGGAVQFETLFTAWNGQEFVHYPAIYYEDTYVAEEFRAKKGDAASQKWKGLGTYFRRARIERSISNKHGDAPFGMSAQGLIGECSADNIPSIASLKKLGATIASNKTPVLVFKNDVLEGHRNGDIQTELDFLASTDGGATNRNIFVARWSGKNGEQIAASFTDAISTFTGEPVIRVQITSNNILPDPECLKDILYALLEDGFAKAIEENWDAGHGAYSFPSMRIHALNEIAIVEALEKLGAKPRELDKKPMLPIAINFANETAKPFVVVSTARSGSSPQLSSSGIYHRQSELGSGLN